LAAAGTVEFWKYWEGRVVDKAYPLLRCLGCGANSAVFLTEFAGEKGRRAAIRLILASPSGAENQLSRWQRAAKLSHPNLLRLLTSGRCQLDDTSLLYLVMEYTEEDLSQVLPERALTPEEATPTLEPVINALRYVHRQGFVHGRLKPSNIMAVEDKVKISSDGLRRAGENGVRAAAPDPHDAPEIAKTGISPAGDVWSLGVTLVEVLTQHSPEWRGAGQQDLILPESVPEALADVARHCLKPDPKDRWSLDQIASRLGFAAAQKAPPAAARPIVAPKKSRRWEYLLPAGAIAVIVVAVLMLRNSAETHTEAAKAPVVTPAQVEAAPATPAPVAVKPQPVPPPASEPKPAAEPKPDPEPKEVAVAANVSPASPAAIADGEILEQVMPTVTDHTKATLRGRFMVHVRVRVDPSGKVTEAKLDLRGPSSYFAKRSVEAARQWKFRPADTGQEWVLRFEFEKTGFKVTPVRVSP
jgi:serine/threonine-protein kinase PknG